MSKNFEEPNEPLGFQEPAQPEDKRTERPLECSECKRPISALYTEIIGHNLAQNYMCSECPVLKRRLFGATHVGFESQSDTKAGLACGECGTTLESLRLGAPMGCSVCYEVFEEPILAELRALGKLPSRLANFKKSQPLYLGRSRGEALEISSAMRLLALNEALSETLKREDYEQAAWLRDQIKALTEAQNKEQNDGKQ